MSFGEQRLKTPVVVYKHPLRFYEGEEGVVWYGTLLPEVAPAVEVIPHVGIGKGNGIAQLKQ